MTANIIIGDGHSYSNGIDHIISSNKSNTAEEILLPNNITDLSANFWRDVVANGGLQNFPELKLYE